MRTKRINLYPFNELSEEAQRKALKDVAEMWNLFGASSKHKIQVIEHNSYEFLKDGTLFNL